ncbi:hypothetical protein POM88_040417 [Heracleum sosnowskyi]|uniref:Rapid alkalinization factor n=1 Tax=Heracleum sosnowskyi TaxID=360622 RepID=A0AAD8HE36_9APIA|nr:hypothetical protein POM88_040417 [Heracleum sosnowskyi]
MGSRLSLIATFLLVALASAKLADSSYTNYLRNNAVLGVKLNVVTYDNGDGTFIEEQMMNSNTSRRVLAGSATYLSYDALNKDKIPCNQRGSSYYNCAASGRANPYQRVCNSATRCARR